MAGPTVGPDQIVYVPLSAGVATMIEVESSVRFVEAMGWAMLKGSDVRGTILVALTGTDGVALVDDYQTHLAAENKPKRITPARHARRGYWYLYVQPVGVTTGVELRGQTRHP